MEEYTVIIEETVSAEFKITAGSEDEARRIAEKRYNDASLVLEPGDLLCRKMAVFRRGEADAEWTEF